MAEPNAPQAFEHVSDPRRPGTGRERDAHPRRSACRPGLVRVFEHDDDLLSGVEPETAAVLRRRVAVPRLELSRGSWEGWDERPVDSTLGLLVLDGLLSRSVCVQERNCAELLGAGDLLRPWDLQDAGHASPAPCSWRVVLPATLAVLDERFATIAGRCPRIMGTLLQRSTLRARGLAFHLAIVHIRQAETRLLMLFWHLAQRWGRVTRDGVVLPLPLTHALAADLVCLHRPTTSAALSRLAEAGEITRRVDGGWTLSGEPPPHEGMPATTPRRARCAADAAAG